jgi:hypothetical protein
MDKEASIFVAFRLVSGAKLEGARTEQRFEAPLGQLPEAALGIAFHAMDLGGVDPKQPVALGAHMQGVAVDHDKGGDCRHGRHDRVCSHYG